MGNNLPATCGCASLNENVLIDSEKVHDPFKNNHSVDPLDLSR